MAKFGEKVFDFKEVLKSSRIPVSCSGNQWFLNVGKNSVVNVHDQKTLHTWTLMHPHYFTCPVVNADGNLYCVMDKNVLLKWSAGEDNLKNAEIVKFQDSVFSVIPVYGTQPLVLFDSGKFAIITETFCDTKPSDFVFLKENEELVWADACVSTIDTEVFCLAHDQKNQNRTLYHFSVNKKNNSAYTLLSYRIFRENVVLKSWCLNHNDFLFVMLWSDGKICSYNIKESKDNDLLLLKDIETDTVVDIASIDSNHIAIAKGSSKKEECVLEIWDSKCTVRKAVKVLETPNLNYIQIAAINSNMLLCYNKELVSVAFHVEDPTFFAALGMSENNKFVQHSWNTDLELVQFPSNEPEAMDVCSATQDSLDLVQSLAEKLINQDSPDLMCISESELVELLLLAIRYKTEENDKKCFEILNIVFSAPFSDILLVKYLKRMNLEETLTALRLLLSYLNRTESIPSNVHHQRPLDLQIVNWACHIINSHTLALLFSKDKTTRKLLKLLEKALSVKMEEYEDFDCIQKYFIILEKDILPQKRSDGKYCIDTLEI